MAIGPLTPINNPTRLKNDTRRIRSIITVITLGLSLSACGHVGPIAGLMDSEPAAVTGQSEMQKALVYWGQEHAKNPGNAKAAVALSQNLKAAGRKKQALSVLQQATIYNSKDKTLASEYGRMALNLGQTKLAQKVLVRALDPAKPDWRVLSALGTAHAKTGAHAQAQNYFQQALSVEPGQSSIVNNLALSYALDGKPEQAEQYLRKAVAMGGNGNKVRQNLALVLGVQGHYNDAKSVIVKDLTADRAQTNIAFLQDMIAKPEAGASTPTQVASTTQASTSQPSAPNFRGTQVAPQPASTNTWGSKVASADWAPVQLTPSR